MKKWYWLTGVILLSLVIWQRYGYLLQSVQNFPNPSPLIETLMVQQPTRSDEALSHIKLPEGYVITYYATDVPGARSMTKSDMGLVFVGTRTPGVVYALEDADFNGRAESRYVVASGLDTPNGVAYLDGDLYVAELSRIIRFRNIDATYANNPPHEVVYDQLPKDKDHGWKYLAVGPDKKLYIPIGMPCNVCDDRDRYGRIIRIDPLKPGDGFEVYAYGIRNTVGFDWDPADNSLWFTDNGRDWLGDGAPPDELNHADRKDLNFGFPFCHGSNIPDPVFGRDKNCADYEAPRVELPAHVAALGMKFVGNKIYIAEHGSWNSATPVGYRVTQVEVENQEAKNYQVFAEGWLGAEGKASGRPVDVLPLPDGSILVSDDLAGVIYKISPTQ